MKKTSTIKVLAILFVLFGSLATLKAQVLIPFSGSSTLSCGTSTVLRDHANYTTYSNNANGFVVLDAGFASVITISGNYITESSFDYVRIYNGSGTGGTLLLNVSGTGVINYTSTPGQTLTVQFITDGSVVYQGVNLTVTYSGPCSATPCSGTPNIMPTAPGAYTTCAGFNEPGFNIVGSYSVNGITYQWQSSTVSAVGPWTPVSNATLSALPNFSVPATTYYQVVVTCTNSNLSTAIDVGPVYVGASVVNTVPYLEDFESLTFSGRLPNCDWGRTSTVTAVTYTSAQTLNRTANSGSKFAAFYNAPSGTSHVFSNGIVLNSGVTYSAGLKYKTDLTGAANWSNLSLILATSPGTTGLTTTTIATTGGAAVSPVYKLLSGTFSVATTGTYNLAIRATSSAGTAQYLSWDDLFVNVPCTSTINPVPLTATTSNSNVCSGTPVQLTANGASTYTWSTGANSSATSDSPNSDIVYLVSGTNTLTGCSATASVSVKVKPSPVVVGMATPNTVCQGDKVTLSANGAVNYVWNTGTGAIQTVTPSSNSTYSVTGTATNNCSGTAVVSVFVNNTPTVTAIASNANLCTGETVTLSANGATTFKWISTGYGMVYTGQQVIYSSNIPKNETIVVTGTDDNGCHSSASVSFIVGACTGINEGVANAAVKVYPNPASDVLMIAAPSVINQVVIYDGTGRVVATAQPSTTEATINLQGLSSGMYFLHYQAGEYVGHVRVIKQ